MKINGKLSTTGLVTMWRVMPLVIEYARGEDDELKTHVLQVQ